MGSQGEQGRIECADVPFVNGLSMELKRTRSSREQDLAGALSLRTVREEDFPALFEMELEREGNHMAAFTSREPSDRDAFMAHWAKIMADDEIVKMTILLENEIVGSVASFKRGEEREVCYRIKKEQWGKGIASRAMQMFLERLSMRPIYARVAFDNTGSMRVLEKCGFEVCGRGTYFARARGAEIEEVVFKLAE